MWVRRAVLYADTALFNEIVEADNRVLNEADIYEASGAALLLLPCLAWLSPEGWLPLCLMELLPLYPPCVVRAWLGVL